MNWNEFITADLEHLDVERWLQELPVEHDPKKRIGEVIAACRFVNWQRRQQPGYVDRDEIDRLANLYEPVIA